MRILINVRFKQKFSFKIIERQQLWLNAHNENTIYVGVDMILDLGYDLNGKSLNYSLYGFNWAHALRLNGVIHN